MKTKILFVDDEPNVQQGLQRMLRPMRHEWDVRFARSGAEALDLLAADTFDVVLSDMRMPGMDGRQLLSEVMRRHPKVVRIILSGQADEAAGLSAVGIAHQYLSKPCKADDLIGTIRRACGLRGFLSSEGLKELISQIKNLPSVPGIYVQLLEELKSPEPSIPRAAELISRDVAMTAKILHLANSAFFAFRVRVTTPTRAVTLLGLRITKDLALSAQVFSEFDTSKIPGFDIHRVVAHSTATAAYAKAIAAAEGRDRQTLDDAFLSGMLHDVGRLVLADRLPERYGAVLELVREQSVPLVQAERDLLGATHGEVGAYLLGLWGLPDPIVETVAYHHRPLESDNEHFGPLAAVHIADAVERHFRAGKGARGRPDISEAYLEKLGRLTHVRDWLELCDGVQIEG